MTSRKYLLVTLVIVSSVVLFPAPARATVYYVSTTGNDSSPCTQAQPCLTIQHGVNVAHGAGNILYVAGGPYTENINITNGGSSGGGNFVVQGFAPGGSCPQTTVSDPYVPRGTHPTPTAAIKGVVEITAQYVTFTCFEIYPNPASAQYQNGSYLISQNALDTEAQNTTLTENFIHDFYCGGNSDGSAINGGSLCSVGTFNDGKHAFSKAIAWNIGSAGTFKGIDVEHNYTDHAGAQQVKGTCGGSVAGDCLFKDNDEFGTDNQEACPGSGFDSDYNEIRGTFDSWIHNYMHGIDQIWVRCSGAAAGTAHVDCFEWSAADTFTLIDRNVCFNVNEGIYLQDACVTNNPTVNCVYGTYNWYHDITASNNLFAFGPGTTGQHSFNICMGVFHVQISYYNNACWGSYDGAEAASQVTYKNNIVYQTYLSGNGCLNPIQVDEQGIRGTSKSTFTETNNIFSGDTHCTYSGFPNDLVNVDPKFDSPGTWTSVVGGDSPNLHLLSFSPAIGAGGTGTGVTDDFVGVTRPSPPAIGPYEFGAGRSSINPPTKLLITVF